MRLPRRRFLQLAAALAAPPAVSRMASAQAYPSRPITVVVPSGPGGPTDVIARLLAEHMRGSLGQAVIVDNMAGSNGTPAAGRVARAKPDGYTLILSVSSSTHVVNGAIYTLPYDVVVDFAPVVLVADNPLLILAKKAVPANDLRGLIAWLKANPDKASLGQIGPGSPAHVSGILFQRQTGTRFQFANYRGPAQALQDLIAGHIDLMFYATLALEHARAGSIKAFAVMARNRLEIAPEIPTTDEAGLPGFYYSPWYALWAPKDAPRDVIDKLNAAVVDALADTAVRKRLVQNGNEIVPSERQTPEALAAFQKAEIEKWWPILKEANVRVE